MEQNIVHSVEVLRQCADLNAQLPLRQQAILAALQAGGQDPAGFDAIAARGGTFGMVQGGAYLVDEALLAACRAPVTSHASNLSAILAAAFAETSGCNAYIYDAVCVNEVENIARMTGLKEIRRRPFSHVLNTRATARDVAASLGRRYEDMVLIVAHLGGGISINLHRNGRIIDLCSDDEGPMSPERAGKLNGKSYVDLCYSGKYTKAEMLKKLRGEGGMSALLGTHDCREIERRIQAGDERAALVYKAQALQIAKGVGTLLGCFTELIDAVILTGGLAYSKMLTDMVIGYLHNLARVVVIPGENEMEALALGGLRLLRGEEPVHTFAPACDLSVIP